MLRIVLKTRKRSSKPVLRATLRVRRSDWAKRRLFCRLAGSAIKRKGCTQSRERDSHVWTAGIAICKEDAWSLSLLLELGNMCRAATLFEDRQCPMAKLPQARTAFVAAGLLGRLAARGRLLCQGFLRFFVDHVFSYLPAPVIGESAVAR